MCSDCVVCDNAHDIPWRRCGCPECYDGDCNTDCCTGDCSCRATFITIKEDEVAAPVKMLKFTPEIHAWICQAAEVTGQAPGDFVKDAVVYYLDKHREELIEQANNRLLNLLAILDAAKIADEVG